jgi:hypothetical protein
VRAAQVLLPDLYRVNMPVKVTGALQQEFDELTLRHQTILKKASTMEQFTPNLVQKLLSQQEVDMIQNIQDDFIEMVHSGHLQAERPSPPHCTQPRRR